MHVLLPAAVMLLIHFTPLTLGAPLPLPVPTAQPSSTIPSLEDGSVLLEAREPTKTGSKKKPAMGQPSDYAHVDLAAMLGDLPPIPQEVRKNTTTVTRSARTTLKA